MNPPSQSRTLASAIDELAELTRAAPNKLLSPQTVRHQKPIRPDGWSRQQILGHLIDSALNNLQRFIRLRIDEQASMPAYDQERWIAVQSYDKRVWSELVAEWYSLNAHIVHIVRQAEAAEWEHVWTEGGRSLAWLVVDYVRHLRHHLEQIIGAR
jgi:hypothetical protein